MPSRALLMIYQAGVGAALLTGISLIVYGIFAAATGRNISGSPEETITIRGFFSLSSHGGPVGYVHSGIALLAFCLLLLRFAR
jgi:hypothetical protein